jgi:hypothetical protein
MGDKVVSDVEKIVNKEIPDEIVNRDVLEKLPWKKI